MANYQSKEDAEEKASGYQLELQGNIYRKRVSESDTRQYKFSKIIIEHLPNNKWAIKVLLDVLNGLQNETHSVEVEQFSHNFREI